MDVCKHRIKPELLFRLLRGIAVTVTFTWEPPDLLSKLRVSTGPFATPKGEIADNMEDKKLGKFATPKGEIADNMEDKKLGNLGTDFLSYLIVEIGKQAGLL
ncbi:hypothetical protein Fot_19304 [Forsythia ovata]|uniref:Uncharacterized protein n=1 Tax=Forsythia ovata TaxID=205694 RepID=A0ABD1VKS6_9LAMI